MIVLFKLIIQCMVTTEFSILKSIIIIVTEKVFLLYCFAEFNKEYEKIVHYMKIEINL